MLRGHYTARIDEKGRLKIPAEYLEPFLALCGPERRIFITSRDGKMILVYPLPVWEEHEAKLATLPTTKPAVQQYLRTVNYWGREAQVDANGRILIHPLLRANARLEGDASVFGQQRVLEICDHEKYRVDPPVLSDTDLAKLAESGL